MKQKIIFRRASEAPHLSRGVKLVCRESDIPRQQLFHTVGRSCVDDADHVVQPGFWLNAVEFAATDQAVHHLRIFTTTIRAEEHVVTASQRPLESVFTQVIVCALQGTIFPSVKVRPG